MRFSGKGSVECVDLVLSRLPKRVQAALESITSLLALALFLLVCWRNISYAQTLLRRHDVSHELSIPIGPFVFFIAEGIAVLCLVLAVQFLRSVANLLKK
ncbi:MAG: TRAP transporter small permease subunit [Deltaproteobacteria bacterium]|nr:TRAP transporter small permease subunit [Deltaproteobacteria bacterium]